MCVLKDRHASTEREEDVELEEEGVQGGGGGETACIGWCVESVTVRPERGGGNVQSNGVHVKEKNNKSHNMKSFNSAVNGEGKKMSG